MGRNDDILRLSRPEDGYPKMPRADRAKQFMPFAALHGFEETVEERQVLYTQRRLISEDEQAEVDDRLREMAEQLAAGCRPEVSALVFLPHEAADSMLPDALQTQAEGDGTETVIRGMLERIDPVQRQLRIDGRWIPLDTLCDIQWVEEERD